MNLIAEVNKPLGWNATLLSLHETEYHDGNLAVIARFRYDDGEQEDLAISVNIPNEAFNLVADGEFFLKTWSEREGILGALVGIGVIEDTKSRVLTGFVEAAIVRLTCGEYAYEDDCDCDDCDCNVGVAPDDAWGGGFADNH